MCDQCGQSRAEVLMELAECRRCEMEILECYALLKSLGKNVMESAALEHLKKGMA